MEPALCDGLSAALLGVLIGVGAATATSWRSMPLQSLNGARGLRPWLLFSAAVWILVIAAQAWHSSSYQLSSELQRDEGPGCPGLLRFIRSVFRQPDPGSP